MWDIVFKCVRESLSTPLMYCMYVLVEATVYSMGDRILLGVLIMHINK